MDYQSISISMQKLCDEFPKHLKIHQGSIAWGAILFGAILFINGFANYKR